MRELISIVTKVNADMGSGKLPYDDVTTWNDFRKGDADAFSRLMQRYYQDLFKYATRFIDDTNEVKDCLQELFLSLWKHRYTIRDTTSVKYYLLGSLRHLLVRSKQENRDFSLYNEVYTRETFPAISSPLEYLIVQEDEINELAIKMKKILAKLSKREQEVIYLRFYEEADVEEIAGIMSLHRQSVYNLLHDALKKLKKRVPNRSVLFDDLPTLLTVTLFI